MKTNKKAKRALQRAYNNLARSVDAAADLACVFRDQKDKRKAKAEKAIELIWKAQDLLNPLAEDEDIGLI